MPEMRFVISWPDGREESCYSPSRIIQDYFTEGQSYRLDDFVSRSREALHTASERVEAKYGMACSAALDQLARIEATAQSFSSQPDASVQCKHFIM